MTRTSHDASTSVPNVSISVVIACHTADRWPLLTSAVESVLGQRRRPDQTVVVVDHNPSLAARLRSWSRDATILENTSARGASGARNTGAFHAGTDLVAFLDDDAAAHPEWLANLERAFAAAPDVVGVGGRVLPDWSGRRPVWLPEEFDWVVGATHRGAPTGIAEVRNAWAENMAVRADTFRLVGGFRTGFGKLGAHSRPEDTDLCIRMAAAGGRWLYTPDAVVSHHVPPGRSTYRFFVRRCYHEGRGKADLVALLPASSGGSGPLSDERAYVRRVLPGGVVRNVARFVRRAEVPALQRAVTILVGLAATVVGFVWQQGVDIVQGRPDAELHTAVSPTDLPAAS